MVDKHIKELGVDGYGVRACEGNLVNLLNILEACRKNLCVQIVCSENVNDFMNNIDAVGNDIVKTVDIRCNEVSSRGCQP